MKTQRFSLNPAFPDLIARAGLSQRTFAKRAGVSFSTIMGLLHPEVHPHRTGGMQLRTAWLLAHAYATLVQIDADTAFQTLIIVSPAHPLPVASHAEGIPDGSS